MSAAFQTGYAGSIPVARSASDVLFCVVIWILNDQLWHHVGRKSMRVVPWQSQVFGVNDDTTRDVAWDRLRLRL